MTRARLAFTGVLLAAAMAGAAVTVAYGLATGFDRAAREADLPDVIVRFRNEPREDIDRIVGALPNVAARAYRLEITDENLGANGNASGNGSIEVVDPGRRGYAIVAGRDVDGRPNEAVIERGVANDWHVGVGDTIQAGPLGSLRVAGIAVAPDNVAFPLASAPRIYVSGAWIEREAQRRLPVDTALIWAADPRHVDVLLQQARATSTQVQGVRFITRSGVRVLIDSAAGVVIGLLVAFSLVALGAAAIMLAATTAADVQRRLPALGVQRTVGFSRARIAGERAARAAVTGSVAGLVGIAVGAIAVRGVSGRLLEALNEQPPGWALLGPLAATVALIVAVVACAAAWPAWRATARPPVALLRGAEVAGARRLRLGGSFAALGARLALARRGRAAATVAVLAVSAAVVLLMLGLASLVAALRDDPGSVGKRYDLTAQLPADRVADVRALPGVADAAPRYVVQGADSFALGEPVKLVAFPGDHTRFEDPPLDSGRRVRANDEAEIGVGLAQALGIGVGSTLAVQVPSGGEARFRVVGTVRALDDNGRVAYVRPPRLLAADPGANPQIVVRLDHGADRAAVSRRVAALGAEPTAVGGATTRNGAFLGTLASLLRAVAIVDALVCLYALVQALGVVARERRPTLALLRATGAEGPTVGAVLAGAALAVALPAAVLAILLERFVLAPLVARLAAGYADLGPQSSTGQAALALGGLALLGLLAAAWVARRAIAEAPVEGLREE
ncbi:MAG TPA: ABC transporter permease [Solirubrobacteraceae bacterium]|nr:ABC transporter permease [Solirubrobacteraceae bacterium]